MEIIFVLGIVGLVFYLTYRSVQKSSENRTNETLNKTENFIRTNELNVSKKMEYRLYWTKELYKTIILDEKNKKLAVIGVAGTKEDIINFSDIINCEIVQDNYIIKEGTVGRALVGGILAGGVGAIVGANTANNKAAVCSLGVRIILKDIVKSIVSIELIRAETVCDTEEYRQAIQFAQELYSVIRSIIFGNSKEIMNGSSDIYNTIDEKLSNLKDLNNRGSITDLEYNAKREELIGKL